MDPIISVAWLRAHLDDDNVRVVDCRYVLGSPGAGYQAYLGGHIPGAVHLDVDRDLSAPPGPGGRHPLPAAEDFAVAARGAGIGPDSHVVAYDDDMTGGAARLWWLLRHFGHDRVSVLGGGLRAWDGPLATGEEHGPVGDFTPRPRSDDTVSAEDVLAGLGGDSLLLVDARAPERFRGEHEPVDAIAGHIPGAVNLPLPSALPAPEGLVAEQREVVAYCGSGVTACGVILALAAAGREDARLYPGSWSEWSSMGLPVALGDGAG